MDNVVKKQIGYALASIWGAFGLIVWNWIYSLEYPLLVIIAIELIWYSSDVFMIFFVHYYFGVEIRTPEEQLRFLIGQLVELIPLLKPEQVQLVEALKKKFG